MNQHWPTEVAIGDFCVTGSGGTPDRSREDFYGGDIPWVKSGELREGVILDTEEHLSEAGLRNSSAKLVPAGSILVAMYGATVGRLALLGCEATTNQAVCNIRPNPNRADTRYLFRALEAKVPDLVRIASGGAQPNISQDKIRNTKVRLPPLDEQRRIAAILDAADALRQKRKRAVALLNALPQSIFLEMFGDIKPGSSQWPTVPVGQAGRVQLGRQRAPKYQTGDHIRPYVRVANVYEDRIDTTDVLSMDFADRDFLDYRLEVGDILLNEGQSTELVGRPAMWNNEVTDCCFQNTLVRFQVDPAIATPHYALGLFLSYFRSGEFAKISSKTSSVAHLGAARFARMPFPVPPRDLQTEYGRRVQSIRRQTDSAIEASRITDEFFAALQHRAFSGQL